MRLLFLCLFFGTVGCTALVGANNEREPAPPEVPVVDPEDPETPAVCEPDASAPTGEQLRTRFALEVHPLMVRDSGGCLACHAADSGRLLTMTTGADETFERLRTAGMLGEGPGSMFDRVERDSMPQGGPFWTDAEKTALRAFVCEALLFEGEVDTPLDEVFPPALETPYSGPASTEYDNGFLTWDQLKGRVAVQFDDDWVRGGVDRFTENISLFGGVDFENGFIPARGATPEFLVGMSLLAPEVCGPAVSAQTGPFTGVDVAAPIREAAPESTLDFAPADFVVVNGAGELHPNPFPVQGNPPFLNVFASGGARVTFDAPATGDYEITMLAEGDEAGPDLPILEVRTGTDTVAFDVPEGALVSYATTVSLDAGQRTVDFMFTNDFFDGTVTPALDRNLHMGAVTVRGPLAGTQDGVVGARAATLLRMASVFEGILLRSPKAAEADELYELLVDLDGIDGDQGAAWSGVCEALLLHPDFLFTRMPSADDDPGERARALVVRTALDLLDRPPTSAELVRFTTGEVTRAELIDEWLSSAEFEAAYFKKMKILLEADGSIEGDEPARFLTYLMLNDRPVRETLVADYTVDADLNEVTRPAEHAGTGLLTMRGFIKNKPGLPHYNYSARVLSGFLGFVFEVPQEVFDQRATATAASTVDETSICFNCHQLLTPLAHQRLRWDDEGNYRELDEQGVTLDDSDRDLVTAYPFPGVGMSAFASQAIRKEGFVRRMTNVQFQALMGRPMRHDADERVIYRTLWDAAAPGEDTGAGTPRDILRAALLDEVYVNPIGTTGVAE